MSMSQKRFSREGFKPLTGASNGNMNPKDVTIDIPLTNVTSRGQNGARKATLSPSGFQPTSRLLQESPNEKAGFFQRSKGPGGRRKKIEEKGRKAHDPDDGALTTMGHIYNQILDFSIITRYFLYVLPLALGIAVPIVIGATVAPKAKIAGVHIVWFFTWIEIVWLSLWVSKLVAQALPAIFMFGAGIVSPGVRKYALVIKALEIPLSLVGWALASLATFIPLMTDNPDTKAEGNGGKVTTWESTVRNILWAALFSTLILLVEKLLVQLISISYHQTQFSSKIQESKHNIYLLGLLYDASRALFPEYSPEFMAEDYTINDSLNLADIGSDKASTMHVRSGSVTPMHLLANVGRVGDKVISKLGNIASEVTGKQVFNPNAAHAIVIEALERISSSEALARRIWMSLVLEGREALFEDDIVDVLGSERKEEAEEAFAAIDRDGNGDISMDEMVMTVCEFGRERKSIAKSMHDVDSAINVLDNLLLAVVLVVVVFVFIAFLNSSFVTTLATAGTALLSLSFVFSVTCQEVLGSCIFLFVKHPFDVGDRVDISTDKLTVERISLLFTVFRSIKDHRTKQVPNILLNSLWIENITRSKAMREQISLNISFDTTLDDVQLLKNELQNFVRDKENSRDFQPEVNVSVLSMTDMTKLELQIDLLHKSNWANEAVRASRQSKFMCALVIALRKVPIYAPGGGGAGAGDPANPSYSVTISDAQAAANKKEFADNKEKSRIMPSAPAAPVRSASDSPESTGAEPLPEQKAIDSLNARPAAFDPARDNSTNYYREETAVATAVKNDLGPTQSLDSDQRRSNDIEEVRDILRRESTKGRRKAGPMSSSAAPVTSTPPNIPTIREDPAGSGFSPVEVPSIRKPLAPPARSESRPGTAGGSQPSPAPRVEYHEYDFAPPPLSVGETARSQSPIGRAPYSAADVYPSNNPYGRNISGGQYSQQNRRPVGRAGNAVPARSATPTGQVPRSGTPTGQ